MEVSYGQFSRQYLANCDLSLAVLGIQDRQTLKGGGIMIENLLIAFIFIALLQGIGNMWNE